MSPDGGTISGPFIGVVPPGVGDVPGRNGIERLKACDGTKAEDPEDSGMWKLCRTRRRRPEVDAGLPLAPKLTGGGGVVHPEEEPGGVCWLVGGGVYLP